MGKGAGLRWAVQAAAAVSWAFVAMAGVAALGLHLLGADGYARLGPMTAAVVALGAGGSLTPTGSAEVLGAGGIAGADTTLDLMPLGVAFTGAAVLGWLFVRPLRGRAVGPRELGVRAATAVVCFLAVLGLLCWAGEDTTTLDLTGLVGGGLGGEGGGGGGGGLGGLLDPGKLGGWLGGIAKPTATLGYSVQTGPTLLAGLGWVLLVLLLALTVPRAAPLPRGWESLRRTVRPVASALWTVLLGTVLVGAVTAVVLPLTEGSDPATAAGGALLGTPNGVGLAMPIGLGVPVTAQATGALVNVIPAPLDQLVKGGTVQHITVSRLMELDGSLWVLPVGVGLLVLLAGVLAAVRTPLPAPGGKPGSGSGSGSGSGVVREALGAAVRLGVGLAVLLPAGLALSRVAVNANLSVFGFDAIGARATLDGSLPQAALYGLLWGAVAGFAGWLLVARFASAKRPPAVGAGLGAGPGPGPGPSAGPPPIDRPAPYGTLPEHRSPGGAAPENPYRSGGSGFNPYADGPHHTPPPPPHPPGHDTSG
ncbi:streptophobe family protein [Peterkaempfera bronchialis]|uniref:streptophobe family protein n=1 Tax=Peterkaempfera bronchialis TaxID=2126346 RepID=UPI003C2FF2C5